jgi:hypothetical protein
MAWMGHDSEHAALIYLHSSRQRQRALADAVGEAARAELAKSKRTSKDFCGNAGLQERQVWSCVAGRQRLHQTPAAHRLARPGTVATAREGFADRSLCYPRGAPNE